jgi:hypothetical protein
MTAIEQHAQQIRDIRDAGQNHLHFDLVATEE